MPKTPSASRARPTEGALCGTPGCARAAFHEGLCHNQQVARPRQRRPSTRVLTEAAEGSPLCRIPAASKKRAAPPSRASPTFVGHSFMDEPSGEPQPWTHEEDLKVLDGVDRHGHSWAKIARDLPDLRTDDAVRNRYYRLVTKQQQALVETAVEKQAAAPLQPAPQAPSSMAEAEVAVPAGVLPGQQVKFVRPGSHGGGWVLVTVPPGIFAGGKFNVRYTCSSANKLTRCGKCPGCVNEDCGECKNCLDKPKFGGRGIKKQACEQRDCSDPQGESPLVKAAKAEQAKAAFCTLSNALQGDDNSCLPAAQHMACAP